MMNVLQPFPEYSFIPQTCLIGRHGLKEHEGFFLRKNNDGMLLFTNLRTCSPMADTLCL